MISRNKGIFSLEFLFPIFAFVFSAIVIQILYKTWVHPNEKEFMVKRRLLMSQNSNSEEIKKRPIFIIIKDEEPKWEIIFTMSGMIILAYKLINIHRERRMFKYDFVRVQPGERIIPEDALDRYKELKTAVEKEPQWRERLLPECVLASLHRFHASASIQDAANAVKERAELHGDRLDSSLSLVRYIAWAIPAIGFIGTVRGIGDALNFAEQAIKGDISSVTTGLGLAFNSTFVGLSMCIVLMFFLHMVQQRQEAFIIETQTFCRDKLIDVMKVPTKEETTTSPFATV
jgi:biopolymer transport protein ExbB/TolQ